MGNGIVVVLAEKHHIVFGHLFDELFKRHLFSIAVEQLERLQILRKAEQCKGRKNRNKEEIFHGLKIVSSGEPAGWFHAKPRKQCTQSRKGIGLSKLCALCALT